GPNGAGKTSILEAIHLLGRGRSFRTRQARELVQRGAESFLVSGGIVGPEGEKNRLGVRYSDGSLALRLDGVKAKSIGDLADKLPVHVIEPSTHLLVEGGPRERRRFLDWGVFHVEPGYLAAWRRYRRILGQRNTALKTGSTSRSLEAWTVGLAEAGNLVVEFRSRYVEQMRVLLELIGIQLLNKVVAIQHRSGWSPGRNFEEALAASLSKDRAMGATQVGPHRADLELRIKGRVAREEVSRGEQKLLAAALVLAQVAVFAAVRGTGGVLLVDDPAAELDRRSLGRLMGALDDSPAQQVLTGLSQTLLSPAVGAPVFHVELGKTIRVVQ
ncbi:MAG: DNA replication and repair protein RecF, partial [Gammaproteobacteria bacterium]